MKTTYFCRFLSDNEIERLPHEIFSSLYRLRYLWVQFFYLFVIKEHDLNTSWVLRVTYSHLAKDVNGQWT